MSVLSLWLFYMQASVFWIWCELQPGASSGRYSEVWHGPFLVCWRPVVLLHSESSVKVWLCMMEVQIEEHCSGPVLKWQGPGQVVQHAVRKGLIFLMLCNTNRQDRAVFAMWSLKVSWSSKITPRFLTKLDGIIVEEHSWMVKSCCRVGVAGKTRSSVFARLSCRWCSFIHAEMTARQPEICAATVGSSGRNER